jgi:hypothetical protein
MRTGDVTREELEEIEADIAWWLGSIGVPDDDVPVVEELVVKLTRREVGLARLGKRTEGRSEPVGSTWQILTRIDLLGTPRGRQAIGHECGHVFYRVHQKREISEAMADAFGVALCAPRRAVRLALREFPRASPSMLAATLQIEAPAALLRVGEATSRSVVLERRRGVLVHRGDPFEWPPRDAWFRVDRRRAHPVRAGDRWGMMVA